MTLSALGSGTDNGPRTHRFAELFLILIAVAISAGAYTLVGLGTQDTVPLNVYEYTIWLAVLGLALHAVVWWRAKYADPVLIPIAILLNGLGLAMIYRIDVAKEREGFDSTAFGQLVWMTLGVALAVAVIFFLRDHRMLRRWTYTFGLAGLVLLLLPLIPGLGKTINGARIWIGVGGMSFQPGEIAKICLALFFAGYFVQFRDQIVLAGPKILGVQFPRLRDFGPIVVAWVASVGVLVMQRDLGTSLLFFGLFVAMLYVATGKKTWIFLGLGFFAAGALLASRIFSHVGQRIDGWLYALTPEEYEKTPGGSYQLVQGLFGMANGGLTGTGLGEGRPNIVPYAESDFIYASLGEELGMVGVFAILLLYLVLFERGIRNATALRDGFGTLFAAGISFTIALQVFIVIGGVTRLIPLTGLTTPFLAAGGSSLVANWIIIALLLRISDNARRPLQEFQTGVLRITPDEEPAPRTRREARAAERAAEQGTDTDAEAVPTAAPAVTGTSPQASAQASTGASPQSSAPAAPGASPADRFTDTQDPRTGGIQA